MKSNTINKKEIEKFSKIASQWWDPNGKFKPLHNFNPIRIEYIKNSIVGDNHPTKEFNVILANNIKKIFHYGRFDLAMIKKDLNVDVNNVFCTKIASKLVRTYTDKHGLRELCKELINIDLNKSSQSSDWSAEELSNEQLRYASHDVIHLFKLKSKLESMLKREKRMELAEMIFNFLPVIAVLTGSK